MKIELKHSSNIVWGGIWSPKHSQVHIKYTKANDIIAKYLFIKSGYTTLV